MKKLLQQKLNGVEDINSISDLAPNKILNKMHDEQVLPET